MSLQSCLLVILLVSDVYGKLPPFLKVCSRNDPKIEDCIVDSVMSLKPMLQSGELVEEYGLPSLEPFIYDDFIIDHGASFRTELKDIKSWNGSNFVIEKFKLNLDKHTFDFVTGFPNIKITGKYNLKAKLPLLDLSGNGDMTILVKNSKTRMKLYGSTYEEDGVKRLKFDKINVRIQSGPTKITLTNLFNGDPTLGQIGNQVVNENQDIFVGETLPVLEKQFSKIFIDVANRIVGNATYDELLLL